MSTLEAVHSSWRAPLAPVKDRIGELGEMLRQENAARRGYLPAGSDVLRAFTYPFDQVRVVIVGQDPYPTPGHPMGLSFSVQPDVRPLPRSLVNIYRELHSDLGITPPEHGCLSAWSEQGVMLLNRVLTTQPGKPNAHRGRGWEEVTDCAIGQLVARELPLVAILWGRQAQQLAPLFTGAQVRVLTSAHPSPLSANRGFFGSRPFSRTNALLAELGADPIVWQLPASVTSP
ncbi:MAG: uracil-DNA glycosylase [Bowdeniella nasicola]|nr:uracil-DNA glycosylase [Bowdeniella nasicola]